ncbi:MAG: hypothetical protein AAFY02_06525 [Pseudomonadota bacterium]
MRHAAYHDLRSPLSARAARDLRAGHSLGISGWSLLALLVVSLLLLGGCGKLPRPFEQGDKLANPLLLPPEGGNLLVQRPLGLVPGLPDGGASLLATGLSDGGIPASAESRSAIGADVEVTVARSPLNQISERLTIFWRVFSPSGALRGETRQDVVAPLGAWGAGEAEVLLMAARAAAPQLAPLVSGVDPSARPSTAVASAAPGGEEAADAGPPVPSIAVGLIQGAPGDGDTSLGEALVLQLAQQGFRMHREPAPGVLLVEGTIEVSAPAEGAQRVVLTWIVKDGLDGDILGDVQQANDVPRGSLDGPWGETALFAAMGAAEGITDLLRRSGRI